MKKDMIVQVFTTISQTETVVSAYKKLLELNTNDIYNKQKAAGSLGGASRFRFINRKKNEYTRIR